MFIGYHALMPDVELRNLTTLAAVADEGSFGRAAARLGYTQSTVSQQIAALEKAVGGAVFDRPGGPKPVRITPLGAVVLAHGRDLLAKAQAMAAGGGPVKGGGGRGGTRTRSAGEGPGDGGGRRPVQGRRRQGRHRHLPERVQRDLAAGRTQASGRAPRLRHQAVRGGDRPATSP